MLHFEVVSTMDRANHLNEYPFTRLNKASKVEYFSGNRRFKYSKVLMSAAIFDKRNLIFDKRN